MKEQVAVKALTMSAEEQQIGNDLVQHHMARIQQVVQDFVELHQHPAHLYMLTNAALQFFMQGMAVFDVVSSHKDPGNSRNANDRIMKGAATALLMVLANRGSKECDDIIEHRNKLGKLETREIFRFLSQLKLPVEPKHD